MNDDYSLVWQVVDAACWTLAVIFLPLITLALYGFLPSLACFALGVVLVGEK